MRYGLGILLFWFLIFALAAGSAWAEGAARPDSEAAEAPDAVFSIELGMGAVHDKGGVLGHGENGFALGLTGTGLWQVNKNLYAGVYAEVLGIDAYGSIQGIPGSSLAAISVSIGPEVSFAPPTSGVVPYVFGGVGIKRWLAHNPFVGSATTVGGALQVGAGLRFMLGENLYLGPQISFMHDYSDEKANAFRGLLALGVSLY